MEKKIQEELNNEWIKNQESETDEKVEGKYNENEKLWYLTKKMASIKSMRELYTLINIANANKELEGYRVVKKRLFYASITTTFGVVLSLVLPKFYLNKLIFSFALIVGYNYLEKGIFLYSVQEIAIKSEKMNKFEQDLRDVFEYYYVNRQKSELSSLEKNIELDILTQITEKTAYYKKFREIESELHL